MQNEFTMEVGTKKDGSPYVLDINKAGTTLIFGANADEKIEKFVADYIIATSQTGRSMVILDPEGKLQRKTKKVLKTSRYDILRWNPGAPEESDAWDIFADVAENGGAEEFASGVVDVFSRPTDALYECDREQLLLQVLYAYMQEACQDNFHTMRHLYGLLTELTPGMLEKTLKDFCEIYPSSETALEFQKLQNICPKLGATVFGLGMKLGVFQDENMKKISEETADGKTPRRRCIRLEELSIRKIAVFCPIAQNDSDKLQLTAYFLYRAMRALLRKKSGTSFILHGFQHLPCIPEFPSLATSKNGKGRILVSVPAVKKLIQKYPGDGWKDILDCHGSTLCFGRIDYDTARLCAQKILSGKQYPELCPEHENRIADEIRQTQEVTVISREGRRETVYPGTP